jgi:L,D-peptidoglycan transpeptidase YkuD (ErfK/YbiS/YcfS/YnhG family)
LATGLRFGPRHNFLSREPAWPYFIAMRPRLIFLLCLALGMMIGTGAAATAPLRRSHQCIVVVTDNWSATTGVLRAFERNESGDRWKPRGPGVRVVVGKKGLAWGLGLVALQARGEPIKIEGDNKAPAGIFRLRSAFGYAPGHSANWVRLPYLALSKQIEGVDDSRSRYYNQLVDRSKVARVDWRTSEQMLRNDDLYKWGIFVEHNRDARPGAGSCIFLHVWKGQAAPTAGCTAMPENEIVKLLHWLDPAAHPVLVQMPQSSYPAFQSKFHLPKEL